ncbi:unnamed protein product [Arabis nemorensis]|uniref:Uncharacterized protein n=1 Tax=Arabis nemorensis TaxID=586526 RepID=A0A565BE15_9BRAS|nr:unnamed protein product [Arabis nemorensis]
MLLERSHCFILASHLKYISGFLLEPDEFAFGMRQLRGGWTSLRALGNCIDNLHNHSLQRNTNLLESKWLGACRYMTRCVVGLKDNGRMALVQDHHLLVLLRNKDQKSPPRTMFVSHINPLLRSCPGTHLLGSIQSHNGKPPLSLCNRTP